MKFVDGRGKNASVKLDEFARKARNDADKKLRTGALLLRSLISDELSKPGLGRLYKVRKGKGYVGKKVAVLGPLQPGRTVKLVGSRRVENKFHRASAAGAPPAPDTNTLKRSAYVEQSGAHSYSIGVATKYARALEFGTPRIKPRPFMKPALDRFKQLVGEVFKVSALR